MSEPDSSPPEPRHLCFECGEYNFMFDEECAHCGADRGMKE